MPESLQPPKGVVCEKMLQQLAQMTPLLDLSMNHCSSEMFSDITPVPRPNSVWLALFSTSSLVSNLKMLMTGPKISSRAIVMLSVTFVKMVGSTQQPLVPNRFPPKTRLAPSFTPMSIQFKTRSSCSLLTRGPWSVEGSRGSPSFKALAALIIFCTYSSQIDECTKVLVPATQDWPELQNKAATDWLIASSTFAFLVMMFADLPPNSSVILFRFFSWDFLMISQPTQQEPVKVILSTLGCRARQAPTSPNPETILTTPSGNSASFTSSASLRAVRGVCSAGFTTTVQPAASAGPSFQAAIRKGTFHGRIRPATPTGSFLVQEKKGPSWGIVWPLILSIHPAQYSKFLQANRISNFLAM